MTAMFAGLFGLSLLGLLVLTYQVILGYAQKSVESDMSTTASVYERLWLENIRASRSSAELLSHDFGFKAAMATNDQATVSSAMYNLKRRSGVYIGFIMDRDGHVIAGDHTSLARDVPGILNEALNYDTKSGVIRSGDEMFRVVSAPVLGPDLMGWIVFGSPFDKKSLQSLESLSSVPLQAEVTVRGSNGQWALQKHHSDFNPGQKLNRYLAEHLKSHKSGLFLAKDGMRFVAVTQLQSLDPRQESSLILSYRLDKALAAYQPLLAFMIGLGILAILLVGVISHKLSARITRPIDDLKRAVQNLQNGQLSEVKITGKDEISQLALAFNKMSWALGERDSDFTYLAKVDSRTGLPNRSAAMDLIDEMAASHPQSPLFIGHVALRHYAELRAIWGVDVIDKIQCNLAARVQSNYPNYNIFRLTNDSLGIITTLVHLDYAQTVSDQLKALLCGRVSLEDHSIDIGISMGYYAEKSAFCNGSDALERANVALDHANTHQIDSAEFNSSIFDNMSSTVLLREDLKKALEADALCVFYQPKYDYRTQIITGCEALVRWNHKTHGWVSPDRFIKIAEAAGYIEDLTRQVLTTAIADQAHLLALGFKVDLSVNYSGKLISDKKFTDEVLKLCADAKGQICLEITETAVMSDPETGIETIKRFVQSGLEISIDDFGTGLSSLSYLKLIPAQELKIDRAFICQIEEDRKDALLVRSTIELAHGLGMKVTAEGVENDTSIALLASLGCDMAQGYGLSKPLPVRDLVEYLATFKVEAIKTGWTPNLISYEGSRVI